MSNKKRIIINFHGVIGQESNIYNKRHINSREFEKIIKYLNRNFKVVTIDKIFNSIKNDEQESKDLVAITFDDGYENNFITALPILVKHNVPATFFLITKGLIDKEYINWPDFIDIIKKHEKGDIEVGGNIFKYPHFFNSNLKVTISDFIKQSGTLGVEYINELKRKYPYYREIVQKHPNFFKLINDENLKKYLKFTNVDYGSHSHNHFNLEYLNSNEIEFELKESKKLLEGVINSKVKSIAFPDGSYNEMVLDIARKNEYIELLAVNLKSGKIVDSNDILPRFTISNSTNFYSNMLRLAYQYKRYSF